ncbi:MAG: hypothetical protein LBB43_06585, partial [Spirochaetaceae bacterium]|nr:hypothetical protein [Spirochaetaceae bacterium]
MAAPSCIEKAYAQTNDLILKSNKMVNKIKSVIAERSVHSEQVLKNLKKIEAITRQMKTETEYIKMEAKRNLWIPKHFSPFLSALWMPSLISGISMLQITSLWSMAMAGCLMIHGTTRPETGLSGLNKIPERQPIQSLISPRTTTGSPAQRITGIMAAPSRIEKAYAQTNDLILKSNEMVNKIKSVIAERSVHSEQVLKNLKKIEAITGQMKTETEYIKVEAKRNLWIPKH